MQLNKCAKCGGDAELDYSGCSEIGSSGMFQSGSIDCKSNGKFEYCDIAVVVSFDADNVPANLEDVLVTAWNAINPKELK